MSAALAPAAMPAAPSLELVDGQPMARSTDVADFFGKRHKDVMRTIRNLEIPQDVHERNFAPMSLDVAIGNGATRKSPGYGMTRDGFTLMAFGFTGRQAMKFKLAYIEAFNLMESELASRCAMQTRPFAADLQNRVWFQGAPVLASSTLGVYYGTDAKSLSNMARDSRGFFQPGTHYHVVRGEGVHRFYAQAVEVAVCILPPVPPVNGLMLFTDAGARQLAIALGRSAQDAYLHLRRTYYAPEPDDWKVPGGCLDSALQRAEVLLATLQEQATRIRPLMGVLNA